MDAEKIIADIESLERLLALRDPRPPRASDVFAANEGHDRANAHNPWFKLWQQYGLPS